MTKRLSTDDVRQLRSEVNVDDKTLKATLDLAQYHGLCDNLLAARQELDIAIRDYEQVRITQNRLANELDGERQRGTKLTVKQMVLHMLALSEWNPFLSARRRWERAEKMYAEGVRRGHYPKD